MIRALPSSECHVIKDNYPKWILWPALIGVLAGNTIEAAADLGGMAAAINIFVPVPIPLLVVAVAAVILALQIFGSYELIRNVFRWLALALLAYVGSAFLAKPDLGEVLRGTFVPRIEFSREFLSMLVAVIGTTLSAYLYTWQSNVEVEEEIAQGRTRLEERKGATDEELRKSRVDILIGMFFSNIIMYFIILSTASTLHKAGQTEIETAAQAAEALRPIAGDAAGILFALGVIGVGFLAVPIMTTGAAYDLCQVMGWKASLHARRPAKRSCFMPSPPGSRDRRGPQLLRLQPHEGAGLVGIVQGFSTPPLLLLILLMTNNPKIMGERVNSRTTNVLGWITVTAIFSASIGLVATWFI